MSKITESAVENFAIKLLEQQGYQYLYGPDIAPDGDKPLRESFEEVLLLDCIMNAIDRINPDVPPDAREDALKQLQRISSPELIANNEQFHRMLTEGIKVTYHEEGHTRGDLVWLIDFHDPDNNDFIVCNQFTVINSSPSGDALSLPKWGRGGSNKRPDVILFINGLPLVVMELKNPADANATIRSAFRQLQTYKQTIPSLFTYNAGLVISDGLEARAGTISSGFTRFMAWKTADGKTEASVLIGQLETLINGMMDRTTLLDLIRHFIVFEKSKKEDPETGVIAIETVKKIAAYHQYYAVNRAVQSTLRASGFSSEMPAAILKGLSGLRRRNPRNPTVCPGSANSPPATGRAGWSGIPRGRENRSPWSSIQARSCWPWTIRPFWSSRTATIWTISSSTPLPPPDSCCGRSRFRPKTGMR